MNSIIIVWLVAEGEEASGPPSEVGSSFVLVVTEKGYGKRISIDEFKTQRRAGECMYVQYISWAFLPPLTSKEYT